MKVHVIIDFMHIFYRYKFQLDSGRMTILTDPATGVDISNIYYTLKDIEGIRRSVEAHNDVTMSICCDKKSTRSVTAESATDVEKEVLGEYKGNRVSKLSDTDKFNVDETIRLLETAGYNVFKLEGFEADDLIYHLATNHSDKFDYTIIYTNDADLAVNVKSNVGLMRYKIKQGYIQVTDKNYTDVLSKECKCSMVYNSIALFKCTCGDSSDAIKGIKGFGPKAFDKLMSKLAGQVDTAQLSNADYVYSVLELCRAQGYLTDQAFEYASASLKLVRPLLLSVEQSSLVVPNLVSNKELRQAAYLKYNMQSLI